MKSIDSLVGRLLQRVELEPEAVALTFLTTGEVDGPRDRRSVAELDRAARRVAAWLRAEGATGQRVLLLHPPGLAFVDAFFGCLYAGAVAVPVSPPDPSRLAHTLPRLIEIARDAGAQVVLTTSDVVAMAEVMSELAPTLARLRWQASDALPDEPAASDPLQLSAPDALAMLQYTSGSTGDPKGVMLSQANLVSNIDGIRATFPLSREDRTVFWLPTHHDMGLIGGVLTAVHVGFPVCLLSPLDFLRRPMRWLEAISAFRGTVAGGPDFGWALVARKATDAEIAHLDLSSWRVAFSGAEPVRAATLSNFERRFAAARFSPAAWQPVFGLAEATLMVSGGPTTGRPTVLSVDATALGGGEVQPSSGASSRSLVGCGRPLPATRVCIVEPERSQPAVGGRVGEIYVQGPGVAGGYWQQPEVSQQIFGNVLEGEEGTWLRTGDLGFIDQGELFIAGRSKDVLIVRGCNIFPQDLEAIAEAAHPAVRRGCVAAFGMEMDGEEVAIIAAEIEPNRATEGPGALAEAIRRAVALEAEVALSTVLLLEPRTLHKTSSGKIQRRATRAAWMRGDLSILFAWEGFTRPSARAEAPTTLQARLRAAIAQRLGRPEAEIHVDRSFRDHGLDSLQLIEVNGAVEEVLGAKLKVATLFNHPSIAALAAHFASDPQIGVDTVRARTSPDAPEPIAVIGIGCRYPGGARDPDAFFQQLLAGVDAIRETPLARWDTRVWYDPNPQIPGKMVTRWGGTLDGVEDFDPIFFGVSPREARTMDPQQRLLLELTWEALENAGIAPASLRGSRTAVLIGIASWDYSRRDTLEPIGPWSATGTALSIASGRISYLLDLCGPCMSVDTACSSSLMATHLAMQSLRSGESSLALVGGVQLIFDPKGTLAFSELRALSPTGRCRSFDAAADGYVRSDGGGVVVLKRLSEARRDGDRVLAVLLGSAVNQDGRSNGLTAPSGPAQEAVFRAALEDARLDSLAVGYVEAHGTGTPLGDPIELGAIGNVLKERTAPAWVGSIKSQIGHTEAGSGVAGLIKAVLTVNRGLIPPNLHFQTPNPHVRWSDLPLRIPTEIVRWDAPRRVAGVNSFGFGGTNVHVLVSSVDDPPPTPRPRSGVRWLPLSAQTPSALRATAASLASWLEQNPEADVSDVCHTAGNGRNGLSHRLGIVAPDRAILQEELWAAARGERRPRIARSPDEGARDGLRVGFLFTGQGSQYVGMALALDEVCPVFRAALDRCDQALAPRLGRPLRALLRSEEIHQTGFTQPALVAVQLSLAETLRAWGVEPSVVMGHSVGEIAAAAVAGVLSSEVALNLVWERASRMQALRTDGAMAAVDMDEATVAGLIATTRRVSLAAVNGPGQVVISGDAVDVERVMSELDARAGRRVSQRLQVSHAFHSSHMDSMLDGFEGALRGLAMHEPAIPLISNLTGGVVGAEITRPGYWSMHVRAPVRFADGLRTLLAQRVDALVEIGPNPTLLAFAAGAARGIPLLATLRRGQADPDTLSAALSALHAAGAKIDLAATLPGRRISLPSTAMDRARIWVDLAPANAHAGVPVGHPLLGRRLDLAGPAVFEAILSSGQHAVLTDHRVGSSVMLPASAWADLALAAASEVLRAPAEIADLDIALALRWVDGQRIQTIVETKGGHLAISVFARVDDAWTLHATARALPAASVSERVDLNLGPNARAVPVSYEALEAAGLGYGPAFQCLRGVRVRDDVVFAEIAAPESVRRDQGYGLHPAVLDAAFQAVTALMRDEDGLALPVSIRRMRLVRPAPTLLFGRLEVEERLPEGLRVGVQLADAAGQTVAVVEGLLFKQVRRQPAQTALPADDAGLVLRWEATEPCRDRPRPGRYLVIGEGELAEGVASGLTGEVLRAPPEGERKTIDIIFFCAADYDLQPGLDALLASSRVEARARVVLCRGAFCIEDDVIDSWQMAAQRGLWGFARALALERPATLRLVDLDPGAPALANAAVALAEAASDDEEDQIAWRRGARLVARLAPLREERQTPPPSADDWSLTLERKGALDTLHLAPRAAPKPGPGEVLIAVEAAGLNFRDVLNALGLYPGEAGPLGGECAGRVVAVGEGVTDPRPGDAVVALVPGAFSRFVLADARLVAQRPATLSAAQAAALPVAYTTAWHGLYDLAGLRSGQQVLVHAAAGGVGMAAVHLARRVGARVLGTASPSKQALVLASGVEAVGSSREAGFSRSFQAGTQVDVVLNSLTGAFIPESLRLLRPGGHFLEMGKAEIWTDAQVAALRPGVRYEPFDLAALTVEELGALLRDVMAAVSRGELPPLPVERFPITDAISAFRHMAAGRHVGKIVLTSVSLPDLDSGIWVVTGGTGAVGRTLSGSLVDAGVRQLALISRRGGDPPAGLARPGLQLHMLAADLGRSEDRARVIEELRALGPVRGVVHAAGVVDDGLVEDLSPERVRRVTAPKIDAARALADAFPDSAMLYVSSFAAALGSPGQASYCAANAAMDGLATALAQHGRTVVSVQYGPWAGEGLASGLASRFMSQGFGLISPEDGARWMWRAWNCGASVVAVQPLNRARLSARLGARVPPLLAALGVGSTAGQVDREGPLEDLRGRLEQAPAEERAALLVVALRGATARVLGASPEAVDVRRPLRDLGLDSLMAVDLQNAVSQALGRTLPRTLLLDHPTIEALATALCLPPGEPAGSPTAPPQPARQADPAPAEDDIEALQAEILALERVL